jgi:hypothetical protein
MLSLFQEPLWKYGHAYRFLLRSVHRGTQLQKGSLHNLLAHRFSVLSVLDKLDIQDYKEN